MEISEITRGCERTTVAGLPLAECSGDLNERWKTTGPFLVRFLSKYNDPLVLDAAMGSGPDTMPLIKEGYRVISNEIDEEAVVYAQERARSANVHLELHKVDWVDFETTPEYQPEQFDLIFSLGNSFPVYFLDAESRVKALRGFWRILKHSGTFIFDTRNYDYILDNAEEILRDPENNFRYTYTTIYTNRNIHTFPVEITPSKVRFLLKNYKNNKWADAAAWPATINAVRKMVGDALGETKTDVYYDFQVQKPEHYDFAQFVLIKP